MQPKSLIPVPGLRRVGLDPAPELNLFLVAGWWQAACASCGHVLVEGRSQAKVERRSRGVFCPICTPGGEAA